MSCFDAPLALEGLLPVRNAVSSLTCTTRFTKSRNGQTVSSRESRLASWGIQYAWGTKGHPALNFQATISISISENMKMTRWCLWTKAGYGPSQCLGATVCPGRLERTNSWRWGSTQLLSVHPRQPSQSNSLTTSTST